MSVNEIVEAVDVQVEEAFTPHEHSTNPQSWTPPSRRSVLQWATALVVAVLAVGGLLAEVWVHWGLLTATGVLGGIVCLLGAYLIATDKL